jgi:hypothetical protein
MGRVRSFAIITTTPNELCAELHNQMLRRMRIASAPDLAMLVVAGRQLRQALG